MAKKRKPIRDDDYGGQSHKERPRGGKKIKPQKRSIIPEGSYEMSDSEMLRIQGLVRCRSCENPFPTQFDICPLCGSNHPHTLGNA